jgi:NitT/TauT family transport system permease protein
MQNKCAYFLAVLLPVLAFALLCGIVEWAVARGWVQDFVLPPPSQIYTALIEKETDLYTGLMQTALAAVTGFVMSATLGVTIAVVLASNRWVKLALYPYAVFFQTVPIIAIAPMLVIWTSSQFQVVAVAACIASIFPVIASTFTGLTSTDPALRDLFKLYNASGVTTLLKLRFPSALPAILTGLRIASGLAVIGAMVGEFVGGGGLGSVIEGAKPLLRNDKIFAAVLLASLMGLALFLLIGLASRLLLRHWHASERQ